MAVRSARRAAYKPACVPACRIDDARSRRLNKFGTLLDWVSSSEEVVITRRGKAVARLVPAEPGFDRDRARAAAARIRTRSKGATLGGLKIKDLVAEGRR